jgi:hypothetical protein
MVCCEVLVLVVLLQRSSREIATEGNQGAMMRREKKSYSPPCFSILAVVIRRFCEEVVSQRCRSFGTEYRFS